MRTLLVAATALMLAGCSSLGASPAQIAQADQNKCLGYGFKLGTDAYAQCRQQLDLERQADNRDRRKAFAAVGAQLLKEPQSVTCNTSGTTFGSISNSTTTCR